MPPLVPDTRRHRRDAIYSREEITVISKYKDKYKAQTNRETRRHVMKKILVDVFTYWDEKGNVAADEEDNIERARQLIAWVRNNWRPMSSIHFGNPNLKIRAINVVWDMHRDLVEAELRKILQVDQLEDGDPRIFQQRNAAAKRVLDNMDESDKNKIYGLVELWKSQGYPDHIRRDRAEKHRERALQTFSHERWLEMGLATITFTVHTDNQGRFVADVHDDVLRNMGLTGRKFTDKYKEQVLELKRVFLEYMKATRLQADTQAAADVETTHKPEVAINEMGYPIIPKAVKDRQMTKAECERMMRAYLNRHYFLASGTKRSHTPLNAIREDTDAFIPAECLPPDVILKDPRNMSHQTIQQILRHWYERQEDAGPESAFRFLRYIGNKNKTCLATYATKDAVGNRIQSKATSKKGKGKQIDQLDDLLVIDEMAEPDPSRQEDVGPSNTNGYGDDMLVRIDMGQMKILRNLGLDVVGPVNGPNEGLPEYEVPRSWLHHLPVDNGIAGSSSLSVPSRPYPRPIFQPVVETSELESNPISGVMHLDSTAMQATATADPAMSQNGAEAAQLPTAAVDSRVDEIVANPAAHPTPKKRLGKRTQAQRSPQDKRQTRSSARRRKIGDDERAAMEAKEIIKTTTRQRRKPKRR